MFDGSDGESFELGDEGAEPGGVVEPGLVARELFGGEQFGDGLAVDGALSSWRVAWSLPRSVVVTAASSSYKGHRYPPEIIAHCVWLYHRFPAELS